jgi:hypothetical protein
MNGIKQDMARNTANLMLKAAPKKRPIPCPTKDIQTVIAKSIPNRSMLIGWLVIK